MSAVFSRSHARSWLSSALLALLLCAPAMAVQADDIDAAKQAGTVGEQSDGYLGVVSGASPEVTALVGSVNSKRRAAYAEIAAKEGAPVEAVAQLAGAKLIERTPSGQYVKDATGGWKKKP